jgi:hypothetical protein
VSLRSLNRGWCSAWSSVSVCWCRTQRRADAP